MDQYLKTARHEAGHAVAALHYELPFEFASIEPGPGTLGTTRLGLSKVYHAVPLFCGPMAEYEWSEFVPCSLDDLIEQGSYPWIALMGGDRVAYDHLASLFGNLAASQPEAWWFLSQRRVQEQIDRVANALLGRKRLTSAEVIEIAKFDARLCAPEWLQDGQS